MDAKIEKAMKARSAIAPRPLTFLSGYARPGLDVSVCCGECYARWCRACARVRRIGATASGWQA